MTAYSQGKQAPVDAFKLSSNENPFPPLPAVLGVIAEANATVNRYPDGAALPLRTALAGRHGVETSQVHLGAGSISVLTQLVSAAAGPGDEVIFSWRSFEAYPGLVTVTGATPIAVPNRVDHGHDIDAMVASVTPRTRVMIVCTPNNPTGVSVSRAEFESLMAAVPDDLLVLLDEAYFEFISDPDRLDGIRLLERYPNLVVLRTFSKAWGLAGLRIGYAVGAAPILSAAASAAIALSVTAAAQAAALVSLDYERQILDQVAVIVDRRERLRAGLRSLGWNVPHSEGNFLWLPTGAWSGQVAEALAERGIVARALLPEGVRVSVGEEESVAKLLKAAADIVPDLPIEARGARLD